MGNSRLACSAVLAFAVVFGCGKRDSDPSTKTDHAVENGHDKEQQQPLAKKPVTADFFGKTVTPLGALVKLTWGSTDAEAKTAAPDLFANLKKDFTLVDDPTLDGVMYGIGFEKETKKLNRMYVQLSAENAKLVEAAWGPGKAAQDNIGRERTYWFDPASGWRAYLETGMGEDMNLELHPYVPAATLLGDGPDTLGFAPQGILGATVEELRERFPGALVETDAAKATEKQKEVGNFVGKDLGKATASVRIELPPTEWERYWTRIEMRQSKDGKVESTWFALPFEGHASAKDELKAMFDKKWGTPKEEKEYGKSGPPIFVYRAKAPRIYVKENKIGKSWNVHLTNAKN